MGVILGPRYHPAMTNPPANAFIDDPLLMAFDTLPANKLLHQAQVALLLDATPRWLEEQRSRGEPPPYLQLGDRMVRYAVGPLRAWLQRTVDEAAASPTEQREKRNQESLGFDELILRGGRRKRATQTSFASFLVEAHPNHEWPFLLIGNQRRPVDAVGAFNDVDLNQMVDSTWLSLSGYLEALREAAERECGAAFAGQRETKLTKLANAREDGSHDSPRKRP
jgi:hypothetical protein